MRFVFDDYELEPDSYRLSRHGDEVHVEPRVFELLVKLVTERHRLVGKEELVEHLWQGRFVGDGVLSRAVHEARRALGDSSRRQKFIKTVHGRGYQFVAAVEVVEDEPPSDEPLPDETLAPGGEPAGASAASSGETVRHRRSRSTIGAALIVLLLSVAGIVALRVAHRPAPGAAAHRPETQGVVRVAVLPMVTTGTTDEALTQIALSMTDLLSSRLRELPGVVVRSSGYAAELNRKSPSLAQFALAAGVGYVLTGSVHRIDGARRVDLSLDLYRLRGRDIESLPLGSFELPLLEKGKDLREFVRVSNATADLVRRRIAPALPDSSGTIAPHDPEAYRLYLLARQRLDTITCGDASEIEGLLSHSLERDPGFALAWVARGFALYSETWSCGREAAYAQQALDAANRALSIDPDLVEAVYLKAQLLTEAGHVEEAYAVTRAAHDHHPGSPAILLAQSYGLRYAGFLDKSAEALQEALALDPLVMSEYQEAPGALLYQGRYQQFLSILPAGNNAYSRFYRGWAELLRGDRAAARLAAEGTFERNPSDMFGRFASALEAWLSGDETGAHEIVSVIARQRDNLGTPDGETSFREAQFLAGLGDTSGALDRLRESVDQGFFCPRCIQDSPLLVPLRKRPEFERILARADRRHAEFGARFGMHDLAANPNRRPIGG